MSAESFVICKKKSSLKALYFTTQNMSMVRSHDTYIIYHNLAFTASPLRLQSAPYVGGKINENHVKP